MSDGFSPVTVDEPTVQIRARDIAARSRGRLPGRVAAFADPAEWMMRLAVSRPELRTQVFRFVDVLPACHGADDLVGHLNDYLDRPSSPELLRWALRGGSRWSGGRRLLAASARWGVTRVAGRFVAGAEAEDGAEALDRLWAAGFAPTVDVLGEKTVTLGDADRYRDRVVALVSATARHAERWPPRTPLERDRHGPISRVNVAVKPSALAPLLRPNTLHTGLRQARTRLDPILDAARRAGASVTLDAEHDEVKDATLALLADLAPTWASGPPLGAVVQAYRRDARDDLLALTRLSESTLHEPLSVRLVKGAYWDAETIRARAAGWPSPVWAEKTHTDACFESCTRILVERAGAVRPAVASHNARSIAHALIAARAAGIPPEDLELQVLYGMAPLLNDTLRDLGYRVRVYCPVGELVPGMAYLVRRLLENTSNESFVRQSRHTTKEVATMLSTPSAPPDDDAPAATPSITEAHDPQPFRNEPNAELRRHDVAARLVRAVERAEPDRPIAAPVLIAGAPRDTPTTIESVNPAEPSRVVCTSGSGTAADADDALEVAVRSQWSATPWHERAATLFRAAAAMRADRDELTALVLREAGKPVSHADADVCEAIDFLEWYARRALALQNGRDVPQAPGERNTYAYEPRGVTVVISPWNFPLAIPSGMVSAALVSGNPVVFKPAEQTPATASRLVQILHTAGVPADALGFLPGVGEVVGRALVDDPRTAQIAFTGSREVGLEIVRRAAVTHRGQRHVKRVVAEMGGKNAIVVDDDADLDEAVPEIVASAFGYAGQKCSAASRVIGLANVYDTLVERLAGATELVPIGDPADPGTVCGPLIDGDALTRVHRFQEVARREGEVVVQRTDLPDRGWYAGPTLALVDDPDASLATDEIFGPILTVLRASDFGDALTLANRTPYALTAGLFSRSPSHIERAKRELRAGNVYVNRGITGALVGRQPFGGFGLSGVGTKAGGPDYLLSFLEPRTVCENTVRQGFAPY